MISFSSDKELKWEFKSASLFVKLSLFSSLDFCWYTKLSINKLDDESKGFGDTALFRSMPVATMLTLTTPSKRSSHVVPYIIFALSSTSCLILLAASSTSYKVISLPPVIFIIKPFAPLRDTSSIKGLAIAASAAATDLPSPDASPVPIIAFPISLITVFTSEKSRLIKPGWTIRSVTPLTPAYKTSSAILNASAKVVFSLAILNKFWFGITRRVSTYCWSSSRPFSANFILWVPSKWKGFVTTPTVRIPFSLASLAIIGEAPVPVPPPIPAAMNNIWLPSSISLIPSIASSAAFLPTSGRIPAPRPLVLFMPSWIFFLQFEICSAWASVLAIKNSTPSRFEFIILLTAFPPDPPIPKTVIWGRRLGPTSGIEIFIVM